MRLYAFRLIGALAVSAIPLAAGAAPAQSDRATAVGASRDTTAAYACPPGYYWEPASYAPHGKFRPAHCARGW
jgi:hypothetical protein